MPEHYIENMHFSYQRNPDCQVVQLIRTALLRRGEGKTNKDPVRIVIQYWSLDGDLMFEYDPFTKEVTCGEIV